MDLFSSGHRIRTDCFVVVDDDDDDDDALSALQFIVDAVRRLWFLDSKSHNSLLMPLPSHFMTRRQHYSRSVG